MKRKIIDAKFFTVQVTKKTIWLFILLKDINDIEGWGEVSLQGKETEVYKIKNDIFKIILNQNYTSPYDFKNKLPFSNIVEACISSGLMQCLWDIQGQFENKSISSLFGIQRSSINIYANFNRSTIDRSLTGVRASAKKVALQNFDFVKFAPFDEVNPKMETNEMLSSMKKGLDRISSIYDIFGNKTKIMIDCHWRFNYEASIELLNECKKFDLYWLECPIPENLENINSIRKLRSIANKFGIKLAGLEKKILKDGFYKFLIGEAYDVMMPDIKYAGGPDEMIEIEKLFLKNNVEFSPHNPTGPISHIHTLHVCASVKNNALMEHQFEETSYFQKLLNSSLPKIVNGKSQINTVASGLGNSINKIVLKGLS